MQHGNNENTSKTSISAMTNDVTQVTIRELEGSIQAYRQLLSEAQRLVRELTDALIRVGQAYCAAELERLNQRVGGGLEEHPREVKQVVLAHVGRIRFPQDVYQVQTRLDELATALEHANSDNRRLQNALQRARTQLQEHEKTIESQARQINRHRERLAQLEQENRQLQADLDALRQVRQQSLPVETRVSDPVSHDNTQAVLRALGEGAFLVQDIQFATGMHRSAIYRSVRKLVERGLAVEGERLPTTGPGEVVYTLSPEGENAYLRLTGRAANRRFERLLQAHKSPRHLAGIVLAWRYFRQVGYEVQIEPQRIVLDEPHVFLPDLVIRMGEETCYLEVEVQKKEGGPDKQSWLAKWENAWRASRGKIWVAADSRSLLNMIKSSVVHWATAKGVAVQLFGLDLSSLDAERAARDGKIWHFVKRVE